MTCIAALIHDGKVYIGGDSAGVGGLDLQIRTDRKVFVAGEFVMGFTSSFRMGQILRYAFTPPKRHADEDVMAYMVTSFINGVRDALKSGGYARKDGEVESGGVFLVGYQGRIFRVDSDYHVGETADPYQAVGCGEAYAKGAFFASAGVGDPTERVRLALAAAESGSAGVRGPFFVESA